MGCTARSALMVYLSLLLIYVHTVQAEEDIDCNHKPGPKEPYTPGKCCEYGWRNAKGELGYPDLEDASRTEAFGKISCLQWVFPIHLFSTFAIVLLGLGAMILRLPQMQEYSWLHPWFGRATIISLMAAMFSSLLIHNEGLPIGVIVNFVIALACISVAWIVIVIEQQLAHRKALDGGCESVAAYEEKVKQGWLSKSRSDKLKSLYILHGTLMFTAWFQFFGRFFYLVVLGSMYGHHYSNVGGDYNFTCYTYPIYKQKVNNYIFCDESQTNDRWDSCSENEMCPVLIKNSNVMPWDDPPTKGESLGLVGWVVLLVVVPFLIAYAVFECCTGREQKKQKGE